MSIEQASFDIPLTKEHIVHFLRKTNAVGTALEDSGRVIGYTFHDLHPKRINLRRIAVCPEYRRQHVGSELVSRLLDKLSSRDRTQVTVDVPETNLLAQLFFRSLGFMAEINRDEDQGEVTYRFYYSIKR